MKAFSLILILSVAVVTVAEAQFKNSLLDPSGSYEPSAAINRDNPENMVVAVAPGRMYYTVNAGLSWEKTLLATPHGTTEGMTVLADFKGNFYCVHQALQNDKSTIMVRQSGDGGKTWSQGVRVSTDTARYSVNPRAAVDRKGNLFVTWTEFERYKSDDNNCVSRVLLSQSSNGKKWSKPVEISQTAGDCVNGNNTPAGAVPAVMGSGERAFVAWANQQKIFFDRAFDGGTTWLSNDLAIASQAAGWKFNIAGTQQVNGMPVLLCNNTKKTNQTGALYVVWADQLNGEKDTDIRFTRSLNFGDTWEQASTISGDKSGRHQYMPAMALDSETGMLYVLYYDRRHADNEATEVYLAYSTNSGAGFKNVKISETPFVTDASVPLGNFIGIAAHKGVITASWTRTENGKSSVWTAVIGQKDLEQAK